MGGGVLFSNPGQDTVYPYIQFFSVPGKYRDSVRPRPLPFTYFRMPQSSYHSTLYRLFMGCLTTPLQLRRLRSIKRYNEYQWWIGVRIWKEMIIFTFLCTRCFSLEKPRKSSPDSWHSCFIFRGCLVLNVGLKIDHYDWWFSCSSSVPPRKCLVSKWNCATSVFLPHPFQFIIHYSAFNAIAHNVSCWQHR
jgi:hypothetical protein